MGMVMFFETIGVAYVSISGQAILVFDVDIHMFWILIFIPIIVASWEVRINYSGRLGWYFQSNSITLLATIVGAITTPITKK